jgi:RNase H-like protein
VHGDPNLTLPPTQVYLDIEGVPDRGFYYLIGVLVVTGQSQEYRCFSADEESREVAMFAQFAELMTEHLAPHMPTRPGSARGPRPGRALGRTTRSASPNNKDASEQGDAHGLNISARRNSAANTIRNHVALLTP